MLKRMPYVFLLVTAVVLFVTGLFTSNREWIDIHLYDTMFVMAQAHILGFAAFFLFLLWLIYMATHRILFSNKLTWFHTLATLVILLFILWYGYRHPNGLSHLPRRYMAEPGEEPVSFFRNANAVLVGSIAGLIAVQLVFIANLLIGWYRKALR
ncbi:hypothetical protein [Niabella drilacis]|uniref:Cytochrome C and Quinol oxidase polypeptide I n=1 Tax=Niabella drilacis (strain DSM 25811 / CCM 8410 / CCUG 62505 / LMG 26954 / E90) TaxID=1285928 RepID=A0A1G7B4H7_NIADE|nr:hypothetical protein [Niabella drilacis]SDE22038.1 hypothetical protein SAMN04487894_12719 [Niabella drilacis]